MTSRTFRDDDGICWQVWDVYPTLTERRVQRERRKLTRPDSERRVRVQARPPMPEDYRAGWLAFYSQSERRRRAPVPEEWETLSDDELRQIVQEAAQTSAPRRRMIE